MYNHHCSLEYFISFEIVMIKECSKCKMKISTIEYSCKYCNHIRSGGNSEETSVLDIIGKTEYMSKYNVNESLIKQFLKKIGVTILHLCIGGGISFLGLFISQRITEIGLGFTFLYFIFMIMWITIGYFKQVLKKSRIKKWEKRRGERNLEVYLTTHDLKQHSLIQNWLSGNNVLIRSDIIGLSKGVGYFIIYMTQEILDKLEKESKDKGLYIDFNRDIDVIPKSQ